MRFTTIFMVLLLAALCGGCAGAPSRPLASGPVGPGADPERQVLVTFPDAAARPFLRAGATPKTYRDASAYGSNAANRALAAAIARDFALTTIVEWPIDALGVHCIVYEIAQGVLRSDVLAELRADPRVGLAEPMQVFSTRTEPYDDPYLGLQHGFSQMNVATAHERSRGHGVRVAVIDSGIDPRHPDLASRIAAHEDLVPRVHGPAHESDGAQHDHHGLAVAGIIAATANNGIGIVGVAPEAKLLALRACWQAAAGDGSGAAVCNSFTLALALARALELHAAVINLSLAGPRDRLLEQIVARALERGIVVVGALPASGRADEFFPTAVPGVIGARIAESDAVDTATIPAPGLEILTLQPGGRYDFESGSSLAAAHVSGLVALLLARDADLSVESVRSILERSESLVVRIGGRAPERVVDACRAVAALDGELTCTATVASERPVVAARPRP